MNQSLPHKVRIVEVGPRDGLQNETIFVPTETKIRFIELLSQTGLSHIEATSFVSPKRIPQLADSQEVYRSLTRDGIHYPCLVPNLTGMHNALKVGVKEIAIFGAASESFSQRNINCSIDQSLARFAEVIALAKQNNIRVRGYLSCVLGCPYEGDVSQQAVVNLARRLLMMGCDEICLGDTIGVGTPLKTQALIDAVTPHVPLNQLAMHFHDTYGQAIANIFASLERGVHVFDSAVAGLGGCPYAKGATGNVATEDVLYLMHGLNIQTGVDIMKVIAAGNFISHALDRPNQSKVANALR